jgi:two-component sensor histidine kinase
MAQTMELAMSDRSCLDARLLLREYSHRINNELASAIGVISIAAARSANDQAKAALNAVQDQLLNYAQVHHALQMPELSTSIDAGAYLKRLCQAISRSKLDAGGIELLLVERSFQMDSERCWRLGLIVSELITNAVRHAFHGSGGTIRVELVPSTSFVECRVTDNGTGKENIRPGHGLKIVDALARSLGGTISQHFGPQGSTVVLNFQTETDTASPGLAAPAVLS